MVERKTQSLLLFCQKWGDKLFLHVNMSKWENDTMTHNLKLETFIIKVVILWTYDHFLKLQTQNYWEPNHQK